MIQEDFTHSEPHTIWIDLSDIIDWRGNYTGIQRTQIQLAEHFYRYFPKDKVHFFRHIIKRYAFEEVGFEQFLNDQETCRKEYVTTSKIPEATSLFSLPRKALIKKVAKSILPIAGVKVLSVTKNIYSKRRNDKVAVTTGKQVNAPFKSGDKVMILGGNWGSEYFMKALLLAKKQTNFKLYHILYDLIPLVQAAYTPMGVGDKFSEYMEQVIENADWLFAISESTKHDAEIFIKHKNIMKPSPITTFRLGDDFGAISTMRPKKLARFKDKFILCVGTFEVRKNYTLLYYVVKEAKRQGVNMPTIIIAGKSGWLVDDILHLMKYDVEIQKKIIHLDKTSDSELSWLYQNCLFTVFPSFYEGWGLPVAESMFYKKLCLASDTSSMPEIAGGLIDYFSPTSVEECLNKIVHYNNHPEDLLRKEKDITKQYKPTTWDQSFYDILKTLYS